MLGNTSRFKVQEIVYDKGGFAVAKGYWDGGTALRLACHWYNPLKPDWGYPQTFGKPQWMMFPDEDIQVSCDNLLLEPSKRHLVITLQS
jgi:hypothetical protein